MAQKRKANSYALEFIIDASQARGELQLFLRELNRLSKSKVRTRRDVKFASAEKSAKTKRAKIFMKNGKRIRFNKSNRVRLEGLASKIEEARKSARKSASEKSKTDLNAIDEAILKIRENISRIERSLISNPNSVLGREFKTHFMKIMDNLNMRFARTFRHGSRRHEMAINDPKFYQFEFSQQENKMFARFADTDLLDEYTSIYITKDGEAYDPPGDFSEGNIEGFWKFWEYTGIRPKTFPDNFQNQYTYWSAVHHGWVTSKYQPARPFITNFGKPFAEDEQLYNDFKDRVLKQLFESMIQTRFGSTVNAAFK